MALGGWVRAWAVGFGVLAAAGCGSWQAQAQAEDTAGATESLAPEPWMPAPAGQTELDASWWRVQEDEAQRQFLDAQRAEQQASYEAAQQQQAREEQQRWADEAARQYQEYLAEPPVVAPSMDP